MEATARELGRALKHLRSSAHHPAQVYTAAPAFASRGDWGFKRPLGGITADKLDAESSAAAKLRFVEVQESETSQGQARWQANDRDPLFLRRWAEKNVRVSGFAESQAKSQSSTHGTVSFEKPMGSLGPRPRTVFDPATITERLDHADRVDPFGAAASRYTSSLDMFPDFNQMSPRRFASFLKSVRSLRRRMVRETQDKADRRLRTAYLAVANDARERALRVAKSAATRGATIPAVPDPPTPDQVQSLEADTDLWDEARTGETTDALSFIGRDRSLRSLAGKSRALPPRQAADATALHFSAGLQYSQPDAIFTQRLSEPLPARVIMQGLQDMSRSQVRAATMKRNFDCAVASGGHIEQLPAPVREGMVPYDPSRPTNERAEGRVRAISASMDSQMWTSTLPAESLQSPELGYVRAKVRPVSGPDDPIPGAAAFAGMDTRTVTQPTASRGAGDGPRQGAGSDRDNALRMIKGVNQHVLRRTPQ